MVFLHMEGILLNCKSRGKQGANECLVSFYFVSRFLELSYWLERDLCYSAMKRLDMITLCASQGSHVFHQGDLTAGEFV